MDCGVRIRKIVRVCEAVTALLMKTFVWDVTLFRRGVMPTSSGSSLGSTLLGLLYLEDGGLLSSETPVTTVGTAKHPGKLQS